jgi:hypothetical protein
LTSTDDILFNGTEAMVWTLVEPGVAIAAASLITIRPLLRALNLSGFDSSPVAASRSRYSGHLNRGQPILRNDIPAGERWAISSVSSKGVGDKELHNVDSRTVLDAQKGNRIVEHDEEGDIGVRINSGGMGSWSQEYILEELAKEKGSRRSIGNIIGVTRTVEVVVDKNLRRIDERS